MGASSYESSPREEETTQKKLDCKDFAIGYAERNDDLLVVRGYALIKKGFTEHWWCKTKHRDSLIVDLTLAGRVEEYRELSTPTAVSYCDALSGPCQDNIRGASWGVCAWCEARFSLEKNGMRRASVRDFTSRTIINRLLVENGELREQVEKLTSDLRDERRGPRAPGPPVRPQRRWRF